MTTLVAQDAPARLTRVRVSNPGGAARRLSLFGYARLVLGVLPEECAHACVVDATADGRGLRARNGLAGPFADRVACAGLAASAPGSQIAWTADRRAFLGPGGCSVAAARPRRAGRARRPHGRPPRPLFRLADALHARAGRERRGRVRARGGRERRGGGRPRRALRPARRLRRGAHSGAGALGRNARGSPRRDALGRTRPHGQRLARLPDAGLPDLGTDRLLPVGRRLRLPRSAPGCGGPRLRPPGSDARPDPAPRRAPVRRGRCAPLVAPAGGSRHAHAILRRPPVAPVGDQPVRGRDRGPHGARGGDPLRHRASPRSRRGRGVPADRADGRPCERLRPLLSRDRPLAPRRSPRTPADGHGGLERWDEPRRPRGTRRERLDGFLSPRRAAPLRAALHSARG